MNFSVKKNIFTNFDDSLLTILILDYNRPLESLHCLQSIKKHVKFNHKVIFYSNGGNQDSVQEFYRLGLIDILILSKKNEGSSIGTIRLTEICSTKYFLNLQCDNILIEDFTENDLKQMISLMESTNIKVIDLAMIGEQVFSERAFLSRIDFYSQNPYQTGYGTGPYQSNEFDNSEQAFSKWIKENDKAIYHWKKRLIGDIGKYAVLETPCGGVLKRRCDTQELLVQKVPKTKMPAFNLSDEEWDIILAGKWPAWQIPEASKKWVFHFYSYEFENPANEVYRRKQ